MIFNKIYTHEEIRVMRCALGITAEELAKECRTTKQTISNVECGKACTDHLLLLITIVIDEMWKSIPEDEKAWRLELGKTNINVGVKANQRTVEYFRKKMSKESE